MLLLAHVIDIANLLPMMRLQLHRQAGRMLTARRLVVRMSPSTAATSNSFGYRPPFYWQPTAIAGTGQAHSAAAPSMAGQARSQARDAGRNVRRNGGEAGAVKRS
jgi:hypothetical protein